LTWAGGLTRVAAFLIDLALVGALSYGLALPWLAPITASPALARLVGGVVGLAYFGILPSRLGGGATVGMRLFRLKVITLEGVAPGLATSIVRAAILIAPLVVNRWDVHVADPGLDQAVTRIAFCTIAGLGLAQTWLLFFNQPTGRLAHDILTGTAVVYSTALNWNAPPIRFHGAMAVLLGVIGCAASFVVLKPTWSRWPAVRELAVARTNTASYAPVPALAALPEVLGVSTVAPPPPTASYAPDLAPIVAVRLKAWPSDLAGEIQRLGGAAARSIPMHAGEDMGVLVTTGFNTGFGYRFRSASGHYYGPAPADPGAHGP
jgi:uncharacterized RDD family membrane protein YckC